MFPGGAPPPVFRARARTSKLLYPLIGEIVKRKFIFAVSFPAKTCYITCDDIDDNATAAGASPARIKEKTMKKHIVSFASALLAPLVFCGCSLLTGEELSPSDITLAELEAHMTAATDPHGRYAEAQTFVMKQEVETKRFLASSLVQMVETKIMRPNFFKITTYDDNQPQRAIISNGECSWIVDYTAKKVKQLDADELRQTKKFSDITSPGGKLSELFKDAKVQKCLIGSEQYYKVACPGEKGAVLNVYVGADSCQIERITLVMRGDVVYDSSLKGYGLYEGVRIPEETLVRSGGEEKVFKVIYCRLNLPLEVSEFRPPVF